MRTVSGPRAARLGVRCTVAFIFALGQIATALAPAAAQQSSGEVVLKSPQAILMDADTGAILFQRNADDLVPPASMSKLMLLRPGVHGAESGRAQARRRFPDERERLAQGRRAVAHLLDVRAARQDRQGRGAAQGHHRAVRQRCGDLGGREHERQRGGVRQGDDGGGAAHRPQEVGVQERHRALRPRAPDDGARDCHAGAHHHQGLSGVLSPVRAARVPIPPP